MDRNQLIDFLREPGKLSNDTLFVLDELIDQYPYCPTVRVLLLLNFYLEKTYKYDQQLSLIAAHAGNRARLKQWINHLEVLNESVEESLVSEAETEKKKELLNAKVDDLEERIRQELEEIETKRTSLRDLLDEKRKLMALQDETPVEQSTRPLPKDKYLEEFLENEFKAEHGKSRFFDPVDSARKSLIDQEEIVSETLAEVYIHQGNSAKAIKIYQQLMLKYPEKSSYFAALIKKLNDKS